MQIDSVYNDIKIGTVYQGTPDNESIDCGVIDTLGYEGCAFVIAIAGGEIASYTAKVEQGSDDTLSDAADIEGSSMAVAITVGAGNTKVLDIKGPKDRYLQLVLTAPNVNTARAVTIVPILYNAYKVPVGNSGELHVEPEEGTA